MKKYLVEKVYSSNTKKDGSPLVDREGKPFTKYSVKVADQWLELKGWGKADVKDGDLIEAELEEKEGTGKWAGTTFKTLRIPKPDPTQDIAEIKDRLVKIEKIVFGDQEEPPEVNVDEIPF